MVAAASETVLARCVVVYDGQCRFCRRQVEWIRARDCGVRLELVPRQTVGLEQRFPLLAEDDFNSGLRVVMPDGTVRIGADGVYEIARRLPRWRWVAWLYRVPGLRQIARGLYACVARNRYKLAGRCDGSCTVESRSIPPADSTSGTP